jgi:branched-chain amino acid transport system permease protein
MMRNGNSVVRNWVPDVVLAAALVLAPIVLPRLGFAQNTIDLVLVFGLFGIGFDLLFGYTGLLSFGQAAFFGTGGFVAAYLLVDLNFPSVTLALLIGTVAAAVVGALAGLVALRRTGIYFAMITVAIAEMFFFLENSPLSRFTGGENGLAGVPAPIFYFGFATVRVGPGWTMYAFLAVFFFLGMVLARRIVKSSVGHVFVAIRDNPLRAAAVGHNVKRYKLLVFIIAAAYAGLAGGLLGVMQGYMPPDAFTFDTSGQLVIQTVIGGLGTLFGPLVGAAVWLFLRDFLQGPLGMGAAWRLALGVIFVLLVCFLRRGVLGGLKDLVAYLGHRRNPQSAVTEAGATASSEPAALMDEPAPLPETPVKARQPSRPILVAKGLSKRYGGIVANSDIDFSVEEGELRGIIGPNGAGKSTFFKMLTCEVQATSGTIVFDGRDVTALDVTAVCQLGMAKSYQVNQLFNRLSVRENLTIAALARRRGSFRVDLLRNAMRVPGLQETVDQTLDLVHLQHRAGLPVSDLAYGEKRRLEIGLALATEPKLLLLDEPLAGMSPTERADTVKLLKSVRRGRTLIVIDHDMDAIFDLTERITVLSEGKVLVEGTPDQIKNDSVVQEAYLGGVHE